MSIQVLIEYDRQHPERAGTTLQEKLFLYSLVRLISACKVIEVGVRCGHATAWLAEAVKSNARDGRVYAVDTWAETPQTGPAQAQKRLADLNLLMHVHLVTDNSRHYLAHQPSLSADLVWIDGDHTYATALRDFQEAFRISRKVVVAHDVDNIRDVKRAWKDAGGMACGMHLPVNLSGPHISTGIGLWVRRR